MSEQKVLFINDLPLPAGKLITIDCKRKWRKYTKLVFTLQALTLLPSWKASIRKYHLPWINLSDPEISIIGMGLSSIRRRCWWMGRGGLYVLIN